MIRICEILVKSADGKKAICIDKLNKHAILSYLHRSDRHRKKFKHIISLLLGGYRNSDLYDKEDIDKHAKDITAMKFFKGQENDRIYCKEQKTKDGLFIIVTAEIYEKKKSDSVSKKEIPIIRKIANYEYQVETP